MMRRRTSFVFLIGVSLAASTGCELIAAIDRSQIDDTTEGSGGKGGVGGGHDDCESLHCGAGSICNPIAIYQTIPADGATGVAVSSKIEIDFRGRPVPSSIVAQTSAGACTGSVQVSSDDFTSCIGFTSAAPSMPVDWYATYTPAVNLAPGTTYKIRVTTAVTDSYGNPMAAQYTSTTGFTTM